MHLSGKQMVTAAACRPRLHQLGRLVAMTVVAIVIVVVVVVMVAGIGTKADLILGSAALLPGIGTGRQLREEGVEEVEEEGGTGRLTAIGAPLEGTGAEAEAPSGREVVREAQSGIRADPEARCRRRA